jgi:hypothetical protein
MQAKILKLVAVLMAIVALAQLVKFSQFNQYLDKQESLTYQAGQIFGKFFKVASFAGFSYLFWLKANRMEKARA